MLEDSRLIRGAEECIKSDFINAEAAVQAVINEIAARFQEMDDAYIAARLDDIREVGNRIQLNLLKSPAKSVASTPEGSIVLADQLTPADMAQMDPSRVKGVATQLGGVAGHTAIMARALGLPAVMGAADLMDGVQSGDTVIIDGREGVVIVNPSTETVKRYEAKRAERLQRIRSLDRLRDQPAVSIDGTEVSLMANVELPVEMDMVVQAGAEGVGLLRSEFMFMNRAELPDEDEQTQLFSAIIDEIGDKPVTIRTLDSGGEKPAPALMDELDEAAMSALGLRGIRLSLARDELLRTQFRAILRARASAGPNAKVRILLPMVSTVGEVRRAKSYLREEAEALKSKGLPIQDDLPPIGVMIEVPGAALAADALAQVSDFFAIGSNDLTMYTLAVDRANEHVAHLFNTLHPAVLRLIQFSAQAALRARIPVSICGEAAGDPNFTALLVGLGLRDLSMGALNIPRVKKRIREMDVLAASQRANLIMDQTDSGRIKTLIADFNALN